MSTPTMTPPGWYVDPTGRHDIRYWDSAHWTVQVADAGVQAAESGMPPIPDSPPFALPVAAPDSIGAAAVGYRAIALRGWRVLPLKIALIVFGAALAFDVVADMVLRTVTTNSLNGIGKLPSESTMHWTAWLYDYSPTFIIYSHPPIALWLTMFVGVIVGASMLESSGQVLVHATPGGSWARSRRMKAVKKAATGTPASSALARLRSALRQSGYSGILLRYRGRYVSALVVTAAAVLTGVIAGYAVFEQKVMFAKTNGAGLGLKVGWGPTVCLIASGLLLIGALVAFLPLPGSSLKVRVLPDGSVQPEGGLPSGVQVVGEGS